MAVLGIVTLLTSHLDSHIQIVQLAQVLIGDLARVGPIGSHQQAMLIQLLADFGFHLGVLGDQVQQPGSTVASCLKAGEEEDADLRCQPVFRKWPT